MPFFGRNLPRQRPGRPILTKAIDRPRREAEAQSRQAVGFGIIQKTGPGGIPLLATRQFTEVRPAFSPPGGIDALSGTTPGRAECAFATWDGADFAPGTDSDEILNDYPDAIPGDRLIKVYRWEGAWWVLTHSCTAFPGL